MGPVRRSRWCRYPCPVTKPKKPQLLKPSTVAQKLDVYLAAMPQEYQERFITREEFDELRRNPPQWLVDLRRNGPHPRSVIAARLRVSNSALMRAGLTEALTTEQISALLEDPPSWLFAERARFAEARQEAQRLRERRDQSESPSARGR